METNTKEEIRSQKKTTELFDDFEEIIREELIQPKKNSMMGQTENSKVSISKPQINSYEDLENLLVNIQEFLRKIYDRLDTILYEIKDLREKINLQQETVIAPDKSIISELKEFINEEEEATEPTDMLLQRSNLKDILDEAKELLEKPEENPIIQAIKIEATRLKLENYLSEIEENENQVPDEELKMIKDVLEKLENESRILETTVLSNYREE
ncbi:MAG: hypothetical protein ACTSVW_02335 [Candidatus Njordarchaeales archaeon]